MGHWEQLGRDNAAERERRAKLPHWRRAAFDHASSALLAGLWIGIAAVAVMLFWRL